MTDDHAWTSIRLLCEKDDPQICTKCGARRTVRDDSHPYPRGDDRIPRGAPPRSDTP